MSEEPRPARTPGAPVVCMQYPAVVRNPDRAMGSVGGIEKVLKFASGENEKLLLYFGVDARKQDTIFPEKHPCEGVLRNETREFVIRVRRRRRRNKRSQETRVSTSAQVVGLVQKAVDFPHLCDVQFVPLPRAPSAPPLPECKSMSSESFDALADRFLKHDLAIMPSRFLSARAPLTNNTLFQMFSSTQSPSLARAPAAGDVHWVVADLAARPLPAPVRPAPAHRRFTHMFRALQFVFSVRPVHTMKSLQHFLGGGASPFPRGFRLPRARFRFDPRDWFADLPAAAADIPAAAVRWDEAEVVPNRQATKLALRHTAFQVSRGVFRNCWICRGFDPAAPENYRASRALVSIDYRLVQGNAQDLSQYVSSARGRSLPEMGGVIGQQSELLLGVQSHGAKGYRTLKRQSNVQLCDIALPRIRELNTKHFDAIDKGEVTPNPYNHALGFYTAEELDFIRSHIREAVNDLCLAIHRAIEGKPFEFSTEILVYSLLSVLDISAEKE